MSHYHITSLEQYREAYKQSVENPEEFWAEIASHFEWKKPWDRLLEWDFTTPNIRWFDGAQLNITENCLDRHLRLRGNKLALIWEPNDPKERFVRLTYKELHERVSHMANVLKKHGALAGRAFLFCVPKKGSKKGTLPTRRSALPH